MRADEYEADGFGKDQFVVTDGEGMKFVIDAREKGITLDNGAGCRVLRVRAPVRKRETK
jgi:hypothetical protein